MLSSAFHCVVAFSSSESSEFAYVVFWHFFFFSISDMDSSSDSQLPFIPSTEVLVKCLFLIAPYAVVHSVRSYSRIILCSHHPCLSSSSSPAGVYKVWIFLAIFYLIIFMSDWFHQISEVAKKAETRTYFLCWLNYSQHLCYLQGNTKIWTSFQGKSPIYSLKFDLYLYNPQTNVWFNLFPQLFQLAQFTP